MSANTLSFRTAWANIRALPGEIKKPVWLLLLVFCVIYTVATVQQAAVLQNNQQPTTTFWVWMSIVMLTGAAIGYAVNRAIAAHDRGESPSPSFLMDGFLLRLLLPMIVLYIGFAMVVGIVMLPAFLMGQPPSPTAAIGFVAVMLVLYLAIFYVLLRLTCLLPVVTFEDVSVFGALGRSWRMTSGRFWAVFRVSLATVLLIVVATFIWTMVLMLFGLPMPSADTPPSPTTLNYIYTFGSAVLAMPVVLLPAAIYRVLRDGETAEAVQA